MLRIGKPTLSLPLSLPYSLSSDRLHESNLCGLLTRLIESASSSEVSSAAGRCLCYLTTHVSPHNSFQIGAQVLLLSWLTSPLFSCPQMVPDILISLLRSSYDLDLLLASLTSLHHLLQLSQQVLNSSSPDTVPPCDPSVRVNGEVYELISQISIETQYPQRVCEAALAVLEILDSSGES
jgi:hypothetical protein